jgi:hypothetical protein
MDPFPTSRLDSFEAWRADTQLKIKNLSFPDVAELPKKAKRFNEKPQNVPKADTSGMGSQCGVEVKPSKGEPQSNVDVFLPPHGSISLGEYDLCECQPSDPKEKVEIN